MKKLKPRVCIVFHPISPVKSSAPGDASLFVGIPDRIGLGETFRADYSLHHEFIEGLAPSPILLKLGLLGGLSLPTSQRASSGAESLPTQEVCAFVKFLQNLSFEDLARTIRKMGFDGIEERFAPEDSLLLKKVDEDLPRLMEALRRGEPEDDHHGFGHQPYR